MFSFSSGGNIVWILCEEFYNFRIFRCFDVDNFSVLFPHESSVIASKHFQVAVIMRDYFLALLRDFD